VLHNPKSARGADAEKFFYASVVAREADYNGDDCDTATHCAVKAGVLLCVGCSSCSSSKCCGFKFESRLAGLFKFQSRLAGLFEFQSRLAAVGLGHSMNIWLGKAAFARGELKHGRNTALLAI